MSNSAHRDPASQVSESQRVEDRLLEQQQLLLSIVSNIPSGVFWKGRDFRYRGCNEAFARSAGVARPQDIVGKTDYELAWDADQADYFRACDHRVMEENRPMLNIEEIERQADGRQAVLLTSKVPLHDRVGNVWGVLGIDTDISELKRVEAELRQVQAELEKRVQDRTSELAEANRQLQSEVAERRRAEEALQISQERYRLISELTSDYAYALQIDEHGNWQIEWATEAFARITGGKPLRLDQRGGWRDLVYVDDLPIMERRWHRLRAGRDAISEFRIMAVDGRTRWLRDHARPTWDAAAGRTVRILGAAQDITDRKQAEEETRRHQDALAHVARLSTMGELTGQLAHELNQPLCTVVGNAQTALRLLTLSTPEVAESVAALNDIITAGKHAGAVIRRLREFVRREQFQPVVLNVPRLVEELADLLQADARRHGATVRFEISDDLPAVRGDPIQLQQVLLNLARNGLEAMADMQAAHRELIVQADSSENNEVVIRVIDRGPGLSEQSAACMFEPFYTTKSGGLGLGLSISRSIAEAHGGRLWADSDPRSNRGTTLLLALPVMEEAPA